MNTNSKNENVSLFDFNGHQVRVVQIEGEPWFVAVDVMQVLGMPTSGGSGPDLLSLAPDEKLRLTRRNSIDLFNGLRQTASFNGISESGLYKLVMRSDRPNAKSFQDWVTRAVLPSIRKDGGYILGQEDMTPEQFIRALAVGRIFDLDSLR